MKSTDPGDMAESLPAALYTAAEVRELDRIAIEELGLPGAVLMERAGQAAFDTLRQRWPNARHITVVCGGGNNAGDGYVVAKLAARAGLAVEVFTLVEPTRLVGDALEAYRSAHDVGVRPAAWPPTVPESPFQGSDVIVDALFGTGLSRPVEGMWRDAIAAINAARLPVLALDVPSGLCADTGRVLGGAVRAGATQTFIGLKQGLFTGQGRACAGSIHCNDLDVPARAFERLQPSACQRGLNDYQGTLGARARSAHKGSFGHVLVIGGDLGFSGAARMAGEAAARCGAGLVSVATRAAHAPLLGVGRPELMCFGAECEGALEGVLERASVLAIGPGLGKSDWARSMMRAALATRHLCVIDADGLNLLASERLAVAGERAVLTPHPGEAARLLECTTAQVEADRYTAVRALCRRYGATVVLKGAGSLIAHPGAPVTVCNAGNPGMATGGMGDLLTGVIAALLAQGLEPVTAACLGVCLHAAAGDRAARRGERGMLASDLLPALRALINTV